MVQLTRIKNVVFYQSEDPDLIDFIQAVLSVTVPNAHYSPLFREGRWDGKRKYYDKRTGSFGSGLLPRLLGQLDKQAVPYNLALQPATYRIAPREVDARLRPHQKASVIKFFKYDFGILKMPTRGGKTFTAAEITRLVLVKNPARPTVFVVDTVDLYDQTISDFSSFLNIQRSEIGVLEGTRPFAPRAVNVWKVQTLVGLLTGAKRGKQAAAKRKKMAEVLKWMATVQLLVVDEWQEYASDKRQAVLRKFTDLQHFLAISATPYKATDRLNKMTLMATGGGIYHTVYEADLVEAGYLTKTGASLVLLELGAALPGETYLEYFRRGVILNKRRNALLVTLMQTLERLGLKTLAMFRSIEHGQILSQLTGYTFLSGVDDKERRKSVKEAFLLEPGGVLLASDIWKKGITLPQVEVLLNCNGGKEDTVIIQRMGRVKGAIQGKSRAYVIDLIDQDGSWFSNHSYRRVRVYEKGLGAENITVIDADVELGLSDLEPALRNWFSLPTPPLPCTKA